MGESNIKEEFATSTPLESRILTPNISDNDVSFFVEVHNHHWGDFFLLTEDIFRKRLDSGNIFIGAYAADVPLGLLETIAVQIDENQIEQIPFNENPFYYSALQAAELSPQSYASLTNNGLWRPFSSGSNVLWLVDITSSHLHRNLGAGGKMVDSVLLEILKEKKQRMPQLLDIDYVLTFTPSNDHGLGQRNPIFDGTASSAVPFYENSQKFHYDKGAFCTHHLMQNARVLDSGRIHNPPHVVPMCYLSPEYEHILRAKVASRLNL